MSSTALFRTEAEIARQRAEWSGPIAVDTSLGTIKLRITGDLQSVETAWESLQEAAPCTSAQTFDWAQAWVRHMLGPEGREPAIVVGLGESGRGVFLWPFEIASCAGMKVLSWLGQDHANYNMGLFAPEAAASFTAGDLARLLGEVARHTGAAAAILKAQPFSWGGVTNPFAKLPHQPTPSQGYAATLGDFDALYKKRITRHARANLGKSERKLRALGTLTYGWAESQSERLALLDTFFVQKSRQLADGGIENIFDSHARAFYREIALLEGNNPSRLWLGYLKLDDNVLATFSGTVCHNRMVTSLASLAGGEYRKFSPGTLLVRYQIEDACAKGLSHYDIGVGAASYKDRWCDVVQPLFDSFIAFKTHGLALTVPLAAFSRLKRAIKSSSLLWPLAQKLRMRLFGRDASGA